MNYNFTRAHAHAHAHPHTQRHKDTLIHRHRRRHASRDTNTHPQRRAHTHTPKHSHTHTQNHLGQRCEGGRWGLPRFESQAFVKRYTSRHTATQQAGQYTYEATVLEVPRVLPKVTSAVHETVMKLPHLCDTKKHGPKNATNLPIDTLCCSNSRAPRETCEKWTPCNRTFMRELTPTLTPKENTFQPCAAEGGLECVSGSTANDCMV